MMLTLLDYHIMLLYCMHISNDGLYRLYIENEYKIVPSATLYELTNCLLISGNSAMFFCVLKIARFVCGEFNLILTHVRDSASY